MTLNYLVIAEIGFMTAFALAMGTMMLRALRNSRDAALELAQTRKLKVLELRTELKQARATIAELQQAQSRLEAVAAEDVDDLNALIIEFDENLAADSHNLEELEEAQSKLNASADRLTQLQSDDVSANWDVEQMKAELALLREQTSRSGRVINDLTKALQRNRSTIRELEKNSQHRFSQSVGQSRDASAKSIRRLTQENQALQMRLRQEVTNHQATIERITSMLRESDDKYRALVKATNEEKFSMTEAIDHLRQQLSAAADQKMTVAQTQDLLARLREMDDALARSAREREFLDARFVELENALEEAEAAYDELNRTKAEYRMLEERFLQMADQSEDDEATNDSVISTKPVWQPQPITPEVVAFDNSILDCLAQKE